MINERLKNLTLFLELEPEDPFNWYAIAMEYKASDISKTKAYLEHLLSQFPNYLATYYQMSELLINAHQKIKAELLLEKGIALAKRQQDMNTLRELQNLLNNLLFEED